MNIPSPSIENADFARSLSTSVKRTIIAFSVSLGTVGILLSSHGGRPLPFLEWTAVFLLVAMTFDLHSRRIPNLLTFPSLAIAFGLAYQSGGAFLLKDAFFGAGLIFIFLFPAFAVRALGAGDIKALMVLGALWGPSMAMPALVWMAVAGGVMAIGYVAIRGELVDMLSRWLTSAKLTLFTRKIQYVAPEAGSAAASGIPFALAMGLGAIAFQFTLTGGSDFSW